MRDKIITLIVIATWAVGIMIIVGMNTTTTELYENISDLEYDIVNLEFDYQNNLTNLELDYKANLTALDLKWEERIKSMSYIDYSPKLKDIKSILRKDHTENEEYVYDTYNCLDYTFELIRVFKDNKIYASDVEIWYIEDGEDAAHANVVVNTSDYGLVYIEPQDDTIIYDMNLGDSYCDIVNWDCEMEITAIKSIFGTEFAE